MQKLRGKCMNNLRTSPLSSCKNLPPYFFMVHLLHRLYGVDAPVCETAGYLSYTKYGYLPSEERPPCRQPQRLSTDDATRVSIARTAHPESGTLLPTGTSLVMPESQIRYCEPGRKEKVVVSSFNCLQYLTCVYTVVYLFYYSARRSILASMSICLCVCLSASISPKPRPIFDQIFVHVGTRDQLTLSVNTCCVLT